uniref:Alpha-amanitin n=1 Tax=Lepiota venenata TaxID=2136145 RepID=A0A650D515_9AGAR|nr:MSDIN [Lepiota venenata]QKM76218.1 alpha-amanitin [Lepiota venenata]
MDANATRLPIWGIGCNPWTPESVNDTLTKDLS